MHSLELQHYKAFLKHPKGHVRFGQAFHDWFKLDKSTQLKEVADRLYELDGNEAKQFIAKHFIFE